MTNPREIESLAGRCEVASGPDRELDAAVFNAASEQMERWNRRAIQLPLEKRRSRYDDGWVHVYAGKGEADPYPDDLPRYTASLDAAMTLVPEGMVFELGCSPSGRGGATVCVPGTDKCDPNNAASPALALCAAALRARAHLERTK